MRRVAVTLCSLVCASALGQDGARTSSDEARCIGERYEEDVRRSAAELANTPPLVAPPTPVDDRLPPSENNFGRGHVKTCETRVMHESPLPLCADVERQRREAEAKRLAEEQARKKAEEEARRRAAGGGSAPDKGGDSDTPPGTAPRDYSQYGCWNAPDHCMVVTGGWGDKPSERERRLYRIQLRNVCERRIYARFCLERVNQKPWCSVDGFKPGESRPFSTNNATGKYRVAYIGADIPQNDFVCPKPAVWKELR